MAQGATPVLEWQRSNAPAQKPQGYSIAFDQWSGDNALYSTAATIATGQTRYESGTDWWNAHCNLAGGGYVAVGYTNYVNWLPDDGCGMPSSITLDLNQDGVQDPIDIFHMERPDRRRGTTMQAIARYDANGQLLWYKTFAAGVFNDVLQDHEGNLLAVGSSPDLRPSADVPAHGINFNPTAANPANDQGSHQCDFGRKRLMSAMKLNLDGTILWDNRYSNEANIVTALERQSEAQGAVETHINGAYGYRLVGYGTIPGGQRRLLVVNLGPGGAMLSADLHVDKVAPAAEPEAGSTMGARIVRTPMEVGEYYAIAGLRTLASTGRSSAFLWVQQADQTLFFKDTKETNELQPYHSATLDQSSNGACFRVVGGAPELVWPVMADFTTDGTTRGYTFASNHQALARVYKFNLQGQPAPSWPQPANLGVLRGFDLHFAATPTADGGLAFASTKWSPGFTAPAHNFGWADLPAPVQNYLNIDPNGMHFDANGPNNPAPGGWFDWETFGWAENGSSFGMNTIYHVYGYWNSVSYVAKLNGTTGTVIWEKQWDEGTGATASGWPGNFRRRQCMFGITEAPDGGLVISGNEGANFDDAYLAKLATVPCDFAITPTTTYICQPGQTGSISLANSGSGAYTYQWSNGATAQTISGLAPGTYQVVATQQTTGCAVYGTYTMPAPIGINFVNHYPCVSGEWGLQAVGTGGSGNFQYLWNYIYNSSPLNIPDLTGAFWNMAAPPPPLPPPAMVMGVSLTMSDQSTGCSYSTFPMLPSPETPAPVLGQQVTPAACTDGTLGAIHLNLDPAFAPYAFQWSTGATTGDVSGLAAGTYTVSITYGQSCSTTRTITVGDSAPCCPADRYIPDGALSSTFGSGGYTDFSNTTIDIIGQFKVDNYLTIDNCTVYMEPGAEVLVLPGGYLRVVNCEVKSCKDRMWRSITASEGAYVQVRNSRVRDGEHAVKALKGATLSVTGNIFIDNRTALAVPEVPGIAWNNVAMYVAKNRFLTTGHLAQPYPGQTTANGLRGYAAIDVANTTADLTGGNNVVDGLSNGIRGRNSNLDVAGFTFRNIRPDAAYNPDDNGSAIYAWGREGHYKLRQDGYGAAGAVNFLNCKWGLSTRYMNVVSRNNNMQGVDVAYRIRTSGNRSVEITDNRMRAQYTGMDLGMNDGASHFLVRYNQITFGDVPPTQAFQLPCYGIIIAEGGGANPDSKVLNNTINFVSKASSFMGIGVQGAANWTVADNQVYMTDNALNRWGIATYGAFNAEVSCNQVAGNGQLNPPSFPNAGQAAIFNNMGGRLRFSCNNMNYTANGMLFNGVVTDNADVGGNAFRRHKWALHLGPTAIIGQQLLRGNLWYNPPAAAGGWGALNENPNDVGLYAFTYNPALINGGNTEPPSWSPTNWFQQTGGENYECANDHGEDYCSQFHAERRPEGIGRVDELVARDSLQNDPYTAETQWMLKGALYKKLDNNPALRDSLPEMATFYNSLIGSATAAFKAVDDGQLALYGLDSTIVAQLRANRLQIEGYIALVKDQMALLDDSTLTVAQRLNIVAGIAGYRQNMEALSTWNSTAMEVARSSKVLTSEGLKAANAAIGTTKLIEENEKRVNEIYLAVFGKEADGITDAQRTVLFDIASQCPMLGGNAVYKARSMYRMVDDSTYFDDQLLCLPHGIIVKRVRQQDAGIVGVVPNPAKDQASLMLSEQLSAPAVFVIFNSIGSEVMRFELPVETKRFEFSTSALSPALYHYQVRGPSGLIGRGKLTIIR